MYILNDIGAPFSFPGVTVLDVHTLTEALREWSEWGMLDPRTTRIVFPGNGARDVEQRLGSGWLSRWTVDKIAATRFWWPGATPGAVVGQMLPMDAFDFTTTDVIIIDDVISSGTSMRRVRDRNDVWMPNARWHALAWVKQRACKLRGFASVHAGAEVGFRNKRVPINSLSTLLEEKKVLCSCAERNFRNAEAFITAIKKVNSIE